MFALLSSPKSNEHREEHPPGHNHSYTYDMSILPLFFFFFFTTQTKLKINNRRFGGYKQTLSISDGCTSTHGAN